MTPEEVEALPPEGYRAWLLSHIGGHPRTHQEGAYADASVTVTRQSLGRLDVDTDDPAQLHAAAMGALWLSTSLCRAVPQLIGHPYLQAVMRTVLLAADPAPKLPPDPFAEPEPTGEPTAEPTGGQPAFPTTWVDMTPEDPEAEAS